MKLDHQTAVNSIADFLAYLQNLHYNPSTIKLKKLRLIRFIDYVEENGGDYTYPILNGFVTAVIAKYGIIEKTAKSMFFDARRFLDFLNGKPHVILHKKKESPSLFFFGSLVEGYIQWCIEKHNKDSTIVEKRDSATIFFHYLEQNEVHSVEAISISIITQFLDIYSKVRPGWLGQVKDICRFLHQTGKVSYDYSLLVPKRSRKIPIPSVYSPDEIKKMDEQFNDDRICELRNHCIFRIATETGMRAGDIHSLTIENVDFANSKIMFKQQKNDEENILPITKGTLALINSYLNRRRNKDSNYIFMREVGVYGRITSSAFRDFLNIIFKRAGIDFKGRKHGPHAFRSSLASNLVNDEVPYEAVRKILGHTSQTAIIHYAKIDLENLRIYTLIPLPLSEKLKASLENRL